VLCVGEREVPVAPASNRASACTNPSPLAAPETSTIFPVKLNSERRLVVPRKVGIEPFLRASASVDGGAGALVARQMG